MGIGYAELFLIVYITHPGVILPIELSPVFGGVWQCLWVWILSKPAERSAAFGSTMYAIYIAFLVMYLYVFGMMRLTSDARGIASSVSSLA